ncbi:MAG: Asp-tRNA(Asn)/Glu-tRNA(Gln) amidotransferase subunit GatA, partial [Deltaproteobacteria bacterium]|nr:Asp-tRNA(Asn)/Glu-tRNA(Gln) amidotransferase subunit GatA [Deltaproteobacteria bacterium]
GWVPPYDGTAVSRLRAAGAVILGKTNMDEFAMGSSNENSGFGPCKNPWDRSRVPGGSSGGSAAAVAAGLCAASLGTDTGGSIRQPASFTGTVGLKPTYGRVSRYGVIAFASSLDQVGPICRTVQDAALITEVIAGFDPHDSTSLDRDCPPLGGHLDGDVRGLKLGLPAQYLEGEIEAETRASFDGAVAALRERGAEIVPIELPHTRYALPVYYLIAPAEASSNLARYDGVRYGLRAQAAEQSLAEMYAETREQGFGAEVKRRIMLGTFALRSGHYDAYYKKAQKVRALIARDFEQAFESVDAVLSPTSPFPAFELGDRTSDPYQMYLADIFTLSCNLAGLPGLSVPCGFTGSGLPIGLQVLGKPLDEETVLRVGRACELDADLGSRRPPEAS